MSTKKRNKKNTDKIKKNSHFTKRIFFDILLFTFFVALSIWFLSKAIYLKDKKAITYHEKSNLDYNVCLNDNDFYEDNCIKKDMKYVASLIDQIKIKFDYNFEIDKNESIDFTYDIVGKLVISDKTGEKSFFEKTYTLLSNQSFKMINSKSKSISETVGIDYAYYNSLANNFKSSYSVETDSKLIVYMNIKKSSSSDNNLDLNKDSVMFVSIPLSERAIDISLNYKDINIKRNMTNSSNVIIVNYYYIVFALVFIILSIIKEVKIIRLIPIRKKNTHDKYVNKILKEYDRLVGEASTMVSLEGKEVIKFEKFTELLDIHDNLGLPIMHYTVTKHVKSYFYIVHENVIYLFEIKDYN